MVWLIIWTQMAQNLPLGPRHQGQGSPKNTHPFYNLLQVLEVLLIKICEIQPPVILYFLCFTLAFMHHKQVSLFTAF